MLFSLRKKEDKKGEKIATNLFSLQKKRTRKITKKVNYRMDTSFAKKKSQSRGVNSKSRLVVLVGYWYVVFFDQKKGVLNIFRS